MVKTRDMMKDREQAFNLYEWAIKCLRTGENKEFVEQLLGELINEVFALNTQLNGREEINQ
ncbi:hypothetical protein NK679_004332 [Salmonella enterica subsp. enterica serovar Hayindogo]|nr:hypothetical protein [Salmonella enterica subsp. enterica serovar Hayindogo]HAC8253919.1 hypothetical protein [Salmonella enterica subsp. indica serovar Marseille]